MAHENPASPGVTGRFEVSAEKFFEMTKDRASDIQSLDLKEVMPGVIGKADHIPRLVSRVWRRSCDEIISENRGIYALKSGTLIQIFFFELAGGVAKAKISQIRNKIPQILSAAQNDEAVLDAPLPGARQPANQPLEKQAGDLARLAKEGLPENPTQEIVHLWAARMTQEMIMAGEKLPLSREMVEISAKSDISYLPMWNAAAQAVVGSFAALRSALPPSQWNSGEVLRQDLAVFIGCAFQAYQMQVKNISGILVAPVRASTLTDKTVGELYLGLLRRFIPEVQKSLLIEIHGAPKTSAPGTLISAAETISQNARGYLLDTGVLNYADFRKAFPKLHACGFDAEEVRLGEQELIRLMKKHTDHYQSMGSKTYIRNVSSLYVLDSAIKNGTTYLSGARLKPAQKTPFPMHKLPTEEVRKS